MATAQEGKVFAKVEIPTSSILKKIQAAYLFLITFINFSVRKAASSCVNMCPWKLSEQVGASRF